MVSKKTQSDKPAADRGTLAVSLRLTPNVVDGIEKYLKFQDVHHNLTLTRTDAILALLRTGLDAWMAANGLEPADTDGDK
jgi:hypothetical protein